MTFVWLISLTGCLTTARNIYKTHAVVYRGIPESLDGCGNMVMIDSVLYRAINIPESFLTDELEVIIEYAKADTFYCGRGRSPIPSISIIHIKKTD